MTNILRINGEDVKLTGESSSSQNNVLDITDVLINSGVDLQSDTWVSDFFNKHFTIVYNDFNFSNKEDFIKNLYNCTLIIDYFKLATHLGESGVPFQDGYKMQLAKINKVNHLDYIKYVRQESSATVEEYDAFLGETTESMLNITTNVTIDAESAELIEFAMLVGNNKSKSKN